ncbi:glycosyltransferase [Algoriphagus sp. D3-2-R+10]|uniref:glycosyltransferase n=1 Tax=Algoriphagus aurantiacus TaxID=3103948 RepID=UPI002B3D5EA5|nr:glycosyltransferase [Algoriphagus sp. D3-2-R+10]MEB2778410.1 glycosyltransferase [Algoriphagus sp. D3-2-R+10]
MIKILHPLLCYYPSQAGGPANTLYWLNLALDKARFSTTVLSTDFGLDTESSLTAVSKKVINPTHHVQFLKSRGIEFLKIGMRSINEGDIIQFSSIFFPPTLPLLIRAIIKGKKVILSPRGELYPAALKINSFQKKIWVKVIRIFQTKIHFHATNDFEKGIISEFFPRAKGVSVIPNFVKISKKQENEFIENQLLFIGRINPIKNIDLLIKAIAKSQNVLNRKVKLIIAGSARLPYEIAYQKKLIQLVKDLNLRESITFIGHIQGPEKDKLIASSYALILPSQSENFGNVVLEALAQGTPVIASKNTPWEILEEHNSGYWVTGSEEAICNSIVQIINLKKHDYLRMRTNAYSLCSSKFDVDSNIFVWENLYKNLTNV